MQKQSVRFAASRRLRDSQAKSTSRLLQQRERFHLPLPECQMHFRAPRPLLTCRNDSTREHQVCADGCSLRCFGTFKFCRFFYKLVSHLQILTRTRLLLLLKKSLATALKRSTSKTATLSMSRKTATLLTSKTTISLLSRKAKS